MEDDQMKEKRNLLDEKMDVRWRMEDVSEGGWRRRWM